MVTTPLSVRVDPKQEEFLRELAKRIEAESVSDALRYCIEFVKLVAERKLIVTMTVDMLLSEPFRTAISSGGKHACEIPCKSKG